MEESYGWRSRKRRKKRKRGKKERKKGENRSILPKKLIPDNTPRL
jgi:hypothetical protein